MADVIATDTAELVLRRDGLARRLGWIATLSAVGPCVASMAIPAGLEPIGPLLLMAMLSSPFVAIAAVAVRWPRKKRNVSVRIGGGRLQHVALPQGKGEGRAAAHQRGRTQRQVLGAAQAHCIVQRAALAEDAVGHPLESRTRGFEQRHAPARIALRALQLDAGEQVGRLGRIQLGQGVVACRNGNPPCMQCPAGPQHGGEEKERGKPGGAERRAHAGPSMAFVRAGPCRPAATPGA